jgi:flagellar basal body-associated protein FliL
MSDAPEGGAPVPKPPAVKAKMPLPVMLLLLLNAGGTGYVVYQNMQSASAAHAAPAHGAGAGKEADDKAKEAAAKVAVGPVTPLDPFIVNLNEPEATRYLKATFELEVTGPEVVGELEKLKRPIRDDLMRYLSSLSVADTQGEVGKAKIQQEVVARIDRQLGGNKVKRMFIVDFMVQ